MSTKSLLFKGTYLFLTILVKCKILKLRSEEHDMKRLMIKLGFHGVRHRAAEARLIEWCHNQGIGA